MQLKLPKASFCNNPAVKHGVERIQGRRTNVAKNNPGGDKQACSGYVFMKGFVICS